MSDKLEACPSCNRDLFSWIGNENGTLEWPHCAGCGMQGPAGDDRAHAVALWNALPRANNLPGVLVEAIHDRMFGIASLGDPALALKEISDGGGLHDAIHETIRALPARTPTPEQAGEVRKVADIERAILDREFANTAPIEWDDSQWRRVANALAALQSTPPAQPTADAVERARTAFYDESIAAVELNHGAQVVAIDSFLRAFAKSTMSGDYVMVPREGCTCARRHDPDQFDHEPTCTMLSASPTEGE